MQFSFVYNRGLQCSCFQETDRQAVNDDWQTRRNYWRIGSNICRAFFHYAY